VRIPTPSPLREAPPAQAFRLRSGEEARSLVQLASALSRASPGDVEFHKAHFPAWLRGVLGDEPLARRFEHYAAAGGDADVLRATLAALARRRAEELG